MPPTMVWLVNVVRVAIAPVFLGALVLLVEPQRSVIDLAAAAGLVLLGTLHVLFWWQPWQCRPHRAVAAAAGMVVANFVLLTLLGLAQPLLWLYPALVIGAGLRAPAAAVGLGLLALAAVVPVHLAGPYLLEGRLVDRTLGPDHSIMLSIALAGLGMAAVPQLIAVNADLHATKAELAELAVADERARLAHELHDLLGRTLSLIAVKAELATRLSATGDPSAKAELRDVQRLARHAVREVRQAVAGDHTPSVAAELAAARLALRTAGIEVSVDDAVPVIEPVHAATIAWVLREAVTNIIKHSGARRCHIAVEATDGATVLDIVDDGRGPAGGDAGMGLSGLADRVQALGGAFEAGPGETGGFRLRARLGAAAPAAPMAEVAR